MIESLQSFIDSLRSRGLAISPAEAIDASRAAALVGPEDRTRFRFALSTTLAKDLRSLGIFDETFESFFLAPGRTSRGGGRSDKGGGPGSGGPGRSGSAGDFGVSRPARTEESEPGRGGRTARFPSPLERRAGGSLRRVPPGEILGKAGGAAERGRRNDEKRPRAGADRSGRTPAEARSPGSIPNAARQQNRKSEPVAPRTRRPRLSKLLAADPTRASDSPSGAAARDPRRRDLADSLTTEEERQIASEIPRLVQELRLRHGRRMRRAPRGRLWMKRAIRENLSTGGVVFQVPTRLPKRKRARVVLVVDVSWSVARAAGLFLLLAIEFLKLDRRTRVFFFVDHPLDGTESVRAWLRRSRAARPAPYARAPRVALEGRVPASKNLVSTGRLGSAEGERARYANAPGEPRGTSAARPRRGGRGHSAAAGVLSPATGRSFLDALHSVPGLDPGAASDYGRAFYALASGALRSLARDSVLIVLGDARSNVFDPLPWAFEEIAERARRVIWLAPEPRSRWGTGDSALLRYLPYCDIAIETRDLEGLAHGVRELAASL